MSRKQSGRFCWCCRRRRPNERFSGRNHARHLCRDCARLPAEELQYRQAERDLERLLDGGPFVPRKRRAQFERFMAHPNARVRALARQILVEQRRASDELHRLRESEEEYPDTPVERSSAEGGAAPGNRGADPGAGDDDPFSD